MKYIAAVLSEEFPVKFQIGRKIFHAIVKKISPTRVNVDVKNPPMYMGKGENEWDCGPNGTYSSCFPLKDFSSKAAIDYYVTSIFEQARKYGYCSDHPNGFSRDDDYRYLG